MPNRRLPNLATVTEALAEAQKEYPEIVAALETFEAYEARIRRIDDAARSGAARAFRETGDMRSVTPADKDDIARYGVLVNLVEDAGGLPLAEYIELGYTLPDAKQFYDTRLPPAHVAAVINHALKPRGRRKAPEKD